VLLQTYWNMRGVSEKNAPFYLFGKQSKAIASVAQQLNLDNFVMLALKQKKAMSAHNAAPLKHGALPYKNLVPLCSPYYYSAHSDIWNFIVPYAMEKKPKLTFVSAF
jgi:hypothetical protein